MMNLLSDAQYWLGYKGVTYIKELGIETGIIINFKKSKISLNKDRKIDKII